MIEVISFATVFLLTLGFGFFLLTEKYSSTVCVVMCMACGTIASIVAGAMLTDMDSPNGHVTFMVMIYLMFLLGLVFGQDKDKRRDWWPKMALFLLIAVGVIGMSFQLMY